LHRRIEVAFPIYEESLKREIIDILKIQLADNRSAVWIDENLNNIFKSDFAIENDIHVRAQSATYNYLKKFKGQ
jgi:polyphosphate kinase